MAEVGSSVHQDKFNCPVCLDLLKDPVTISCGHTFCKLCIHRFWDEEHQKRIYSCPQCKESFFPRPAPRRNYLLAEVVEELNRADCYAGPGDVKCDFCSFRKRKAVNSCLVCLVSFCEKHLKPHYQSPAFKKHKLVEPCAELQEKICSQLDKLMEIYCRTDQRFICYLCTMDQHRRHDTVTSNTETEKQTPQRDSERETGAVGRGQTQTCPEETDYQSSQLDPPMLRPCQQRIQEKQKKVQELIQSVDVIKARSQEAVDESEMIFTELIGFMEKKRSEVTELIRAQEEAELSRAERLLKELKQEIVDLQRRVTELEQLSHTHDHIHFLQRFPSLCVPPGCDDSPRFTVNQHLSFDGVKKSLSDLKKRVEEICEKKFNQIHPQAAAVQIILPSEPKSREDFLQYFCYLSLDPNTAHRYFVLSENNTVMTYSETEQQYSDHPERFDSRIRVLCKESV